ncbi:MAG: hypothetical protein ACPL0C_01470 [Candidatus Bathyarchaeales archaeon]
MSILQEIKAIARRNIFLRESYYLVKPLLGGNEFYTLVTNPLGVMKNTVTG